MYKHEHKIQLHKWKHRKKISKRNVTTQISKIDNIKTNSSRLSKIEVDTTTSPIRTRFESRKQAERPSESSGANSSPLDRFSLLSLAWYRNHSSTSSSSSSSSSSKQ